MGKRGPKPKSAAEIELSGNPGRRPPRDDPAVVPLPTVPAPADWLSETGRAYFADFAVDLVARQMLAACDVPALALLANAWADYESAVLDIAQHGASGKTAKGYEFPRPAVQLRNQAAGLILQLSTRFGLTPVDRLGLGSRPNSKLPISGGADPLGDILGDDPPPDGPNGAPAAGVPSALDFLESPPMPKSKPRRGESTGKRAASAAARTLRNPRASADAKCAAASALTQAPDRARKRSRSRKRC